MNTKKILAVVLLAFVAGSAGFLIIKETHGSAGDEPVGVTGSQPLPRKLVAFYFHGAKRCNTCRAIERQAKEALENGFSEAMMSGRVEWRVVNLDEPANDHYYRDFQLTGSSLVFVDYIEGKQSRFKVLQKTWDLFADPPAFISYVQTEMKSWLEVL